MLCTGRNVAHGSISVLDFCAFDVDQSKSHRTLSSERTLRFMPEKR